MTHFPDTAITVLSICSGEFLCPMQFSNTTFQYKSWLILPVVQGIQPSPGQERKDGWTVIGVDRSRPLLRKARKKSKHVRWICQDLRELLDKL
jgi:hypothetical protein